MRMPVLVRMSLRWRTILLLPLWLFGTIVLGVGVSILLMLLASVLDRRIAEPTSLLWAPSVAFGWVVAWSIHELWACPISATTPRLRRALVVETSVLLALFAAAIGAIGADTVKSDIAGSAVDMKLALFSATFATCLLGSSIGLLVANPTRFRSMWSAFGMVLALFGAIWLAGPLTLWIVALPWILGPIAVALALAIIHHALSAREHRRFLAVSGGATGESRADPAVLDTAFRSPRSASSWAPAWKGGRSWLRATLHELHGASAGGWIGHVALWTAVLLAIQLTAFASVGWYEPSSWRMVADNMLSEQESLWRATAGFWAVAFAVWTVSTPCVPRASFVRSTTRLERARTAWAVCTLRTGVLLGGLLIGVTALGAVSIAALVSAGARAPVVRGLPDIVGAVAALGIVAPLGAWFRLRQIDLRRDGSGFPGALHQGMVATVVVLGYVAAVQGLGTLWFRTEAIHPIVPVVVFSSLLVGSWALFRLALTREFQRAPLPT